MSFVPLSPPLFVSRLYTAAPRCFQTALRDEVADHAVDSGGFPCRRLRQAFFERRGSASGHWIPPAWTARAHFTNFVRQAEVTVVGAPSNPSDFFQEPWPPGIHETYKGVLQNFLKRAVKYTAHLYQLSRLNKVHFFTSGLSPKPSKALQHSCCFMLLLSISRNHHSCYTVHARTLCVGLAPLLRGYFGVFTTQNIEGTSAFFLHKFVASGTDDAL